MPSPAEIKAANEEATAARNLHFVQTLERCDGFKDWLGPKIFKAYDAAADAILAAHAKGETPSAKDIATYHGLHEVVVSCRRDKTSALNKRNKTHI